MRTSHRPFRRFGWVALVGVAAGLGLWLSIDDWSRDFVSYEAEVSDEATDERLAPLISDRSVDDLSLAMRWAAHRLRGWELVGESRDGSTSIVLFVRTLRPLGIKDDIVMRIEDRGDRRVVTGGSRSRLAIGDLGRNPRNLHRLLTEMRAVLEGSMSDPEAPGS